MTQVFQDPDAIAHNPVRLAACNVHHEAHTTGLVLVGRIVESLPLRSAFHLRVHFL